MAHYSFSLVAAAPAAEVFAYLARFSNARRWDPGVVSGQDLTPGEVVVGSRFGLVVRFAGRELPLEYRVSELEPGRRVVLEAQNQFVKSRDVIEVEDTGEPGAPGCCVRYSARLAGRGLGVVLGPVLTSALRRTGDRARASLQDKLSTSLASA